MNLTKSSYRPIFFVDMISSVLDEGPSHSNGKHMMHTSGKAIVLYDGRNHDSDTIVEKSRLE